jgi:hypothetical protein
LHLLTLKIVPDMKKKFLNEFMIKKHNSVY